VVGFMRRVHRGISSGVLVFIVSLAILAILSYSFMNVISILQHQSSGYKRSIWYSGLHEIYSLILDKEGGRVLIFNAGISDIVVDKLVVVGSGGETLALNPLDACNSTVIPSQSAIECSPRYEYTAVVTVEGVVIYLRSPLRRGIIEPTTVYMIPITFNFITMEDFKQEFNIDPDLVKYPRPGDREARGMTGNKVLRVPPGLDFDEDVQVLTDPPGIAFGVAVIGYDPSWLEEVKSNPDAPPRFRILIASPGYTGTERYIIGNRVRPVAGLGNRIHIWNFTGTIKIYNSTSRSYIACVSSDPGECSGISLCAIGAWYYGTTDLGLRIYINGDASFVAYFQRMAGGGEVGETSYYPYLFIGDIDGNGIPELIFITEDAIFGSIIYVKDRYGSNDYYCPPQGSCDDLWDESTTPLVLRLDKIGRELGNPEGYIDGSTYAGLLLYINILFHDNSHPDTMQLSDNERTDWILKIILIGEDGSNYTIREYRYQEICNYHKTRITDFERDNYFVKISHSIFIPLPSSGRYWVAIVIQDPYSLRYDRSLRAYRNDADVTIGIELIGVIPFYR